MYQKWCFLMFSCGTFVFHIPDCSVPSIFVLPSLLPLVVRKAKVKTFAFSPCFPPFPFHLCFPPSLPPHLTLSGSWPSQRPNPPHMTLNPPHSTSAPGQSFPLTAHSLLCSLWSTLPSLHPYHHLPPCSANTTHMQHTIEFANANAPRNTNFTNNVFDTGKWKCARPIFDPRHSKIPLFATVVPYPFKPKPSSVRPILIP